MQVINIGEIIILDQNQADALLSLGFMYTKRIIGDKEAFVFIQTMELMQELNSKFEDGSFIISKNICF